MNLPAKYLVAFVVSFILVLFGCAAKKAYPPKIEPVAQAQPTPAVEKKAAETGPQETLPLSQETPPTIEKEKKPEPEPEPQKTKTPTNGETIDHIDMGINDIVKQFGYTTDIQLPENFKKRVAYYILYFSNDQKGSSFYRRAMNRSRQYLPMIKAVFEIKNLPESLIYLPIVESGYNSNVRSRAGAVGMWQFMKGTAKMYGLKITRWQDERKDPEKATAAAAEYLNDLLAMFGMEDPFLGICAYNAGEGKILRALRQISYKERSFWTLVKKELLREETNEYIPRFLAAILMAKDPARYITASEAFNQESNDLEDQEVINSLTASNSKEDWTDEKNETAAPALEAAPASTQSNFPPVENIPGEINYKVQKGETLYRIAKKFNVAVETLREWNHLRDNYIKVGQFLKIYRSSTPLPRSSPAAKPSAGKYKLIYTVNYSDYLVRIALFFKGVSARDIMRWNGLRHTRLHPGQKLAIFLKSPPKKVLKHHVKQGESAHSIAQKYGLRLEFVLSLNGLLTNSRLKPGQVLNIYIF